MDISRRSRQQDGEGTTSRRLGCRATERFADVMVSTATPVGFNRRSSRRRRLCAVTLQYRTLQQVEMRDGDAKGQSRYGSHHVVTRAYFSGSVRTALLMTTYTAVIARFLQFSR